MPYFWACGLNFGLDISLDNHTDCTRQALGLADLAREHPDWF